jgi:hypothetical protein
MLFDWLILCVVEIVVIVIIIILLLILKIETFGFHGSGGCDDAHSSLFVRNIFFLLNIIIEKKKTSPGI